MTIEVEPLQRAQAGTPPKRRLRVGVFGGFGIGNFGNDASLEAMLLFLRAAYPDAELTCICTKPKGLAPRFNIEAVPTAIMPTSRPLLIANKLMLRLPSALASWIYSFNILRRFDVVVSAGTGVFDDFRDTPWGWPSRQLRWSVCARLRKVRWAFVSVGAGPLISPVSRLLMKWAAQLAQHRSYRDEDSYQFMQRLGVDGPNDAVLPDLAFLLPPPADVPRPAGAPLRVGVGVMTYRGWIDSDAAYQSYVDTHLRLIQWLEAQGHSVRPVIGQSPADLTALRDIEKRLGRKLAGPREEGATSIHDAMAAIAETDVVIASRYHVQIAALKMGRPLISLGYGPKNDALMDDVGLSDFKHELEAVDFDRLTGQFEKLVAGRETYAQHVRERVSAMTEKLKTALKELEILSD